MSIYRGRVRIILPVLFLTLGAIAADSRAEDARLEAAKGIGDYLVETARKDGEGLYWAQYEGPGPAAFGETLDFPVSLYTGTAGTGYFLLNLHLATGDKKYLRAAVGAGLRLVRTAKSLPGGGLQWSGTYQSKGRSVPDGARVGLYTGNAGIGLFLAHLGETSRDKRFRKAAAGAFERILDEVETEGEGAHWQHSFMDIIGGEAGIGLALLEMARLTGNKRYSRAAQEAAKWLISIADRSEKRVCWKKYGFLDAGFSHGTSGVAYFLRLTGRKAAVKAATDAADWVRSVAKDCPKPEDAVLWEYYAGEPPEGKHNWVMNSWCHGAPGTVKLFVLQHRLTGRKEDLLTAERGGGGILNKLRLPGDKPFYHNPSYCCGAAGCIAAFCDIYQASGEKRWLEAAQALADDVIQTLRKMESGRVYAIYDTPDRTEKKHPFVPTGFMLGNAGIGHALLRVALLTAGKQDQMIHLPDQPFTPLGGK